MEEKVSGYFFLNTVYTYLSGNGLDEWHLASDWFSDRFKPNVATVVVLVWQRHWNWKWLSPNDSFAVVKVDLSVKL